MPSHGISTRGGIPSAFFLLLLTLLPSCTDGSSPRSPAKLWPDLEAGPYGVGFRVEHVYDYARTFKNRTDFFGERTGGEIARPLAISIWYPISDPAAGRPVRTRRYYDATATETDFTPPDQETLDASLARISRVLTMEFGVEEARRAEVLSRLDSVFALEDLAREDAPPAEGPFPLVLHLPGYNGSPKDPNPLFEYLASHGYVVMAVPNMGVRSRDIDNEAMSMDVQARDLEFVYGWARNLPFVDAGHVATTGMSWGGMSNVLFASRNAYVDAAVTFDGAITMPVELDLLQKVPGFELGSLRAAYLQLMVAPEEAVFRPKDLRFWNALRYSDARMLQFSGVDHAAFVPGNLRLRLLAEEDPERVAYLEEFSRVLCRYTLAFLDAHLKGDTTAAAFVAAAPESNGVPARMVVRSASKEAIRPPPSRVEFADILERRGVDAAEKVYLAVKETHPDLQLITSSLMGPRYMAAMEAGDLDRALALCRLWARALPEDVGPLFSMARVYRAQDDTAQAIQTYQRILEIDPNHPSAERARSAIRELGGGGQ